MRKFLREVLSLGIIIGCIWTTLFIAVYNYRYQLFDLVTSKSKIDTNRSNEPAIILSGSSTMKYGCNPEHLQKETSRPALLIANDAYSPAQNFHDIKDIIKNSDLVIQTVDPWIYLNSYCTIQNERLATIPLKLRADAANNPIYPVSLAQQIREFLTFIRSIGFVETRLLPTHQCKTESYLPSSRLIGSTSHPVLDDFQITYLDSIIKLTSKVGAEILFIFPPKTDRYRYESEEMNRFTFDYLKRLNQPVQPFELPDTSFFADDVHLNCSGSERFTTDLIRFIQDSYALQQP